MNPSVTAGLTYSPVGATRPADPAWAGQPPGFRRFARTVVIGRGADVWEQASDEVMRWGIKRRSGFRVMPCEGSADRVTAGAEYRITAGWGRATVHEPVRVVQIVDTADRRGFAYGTLPGHPVSGEEAFVVHRDIDGTVQLTLRSLTRQAPDGPWRAAFPLLLVAQRFYRRRYLTVMAP